MATNSVLRFRRSAAQLHALACVEREIRAADSLGKRKYLKDYVDSFHNYRSILLPVELDSFLRDADIILVGDYHALPAAQYCAASLASRIRNLSKRPVSLALEAIEARDQHIVDEWFRGEIPIDEVRDRIRFDVTWGYAWEPYRRMLEQVRPNVSGVYAIDCSPRTNMRSLLTRDRHAAMKIAALRENDPSSPVVVLFGESHLAPNHLPAQLSKLRPGDRVVTVLQNVDSLYWRAAGEPVENVEAVKVNEDVVCVFNSTPLEKYERYRLCLEGWRQLAPRTPDLAPCFNNLIEALLGFLKIDPHRTAVDKNSMLIDAMPEVVFQPSLQQADRFLKRRRVPEEERCQVTKRLGEAGSEYVQSINTILAVDFQIEQAAVQASRFVHAAASGLLMRSEKPIRQDEAYYRSVVAEALGFLGSKIICPGRSTLHTNLGIGNADGRLFGQELGMHWYSEYLSGTLSKRHLRNLFTRGFDAPGVAESICQLAFGQRGMSGPGKKRPQSATSGKLKSVLSVANEARSTSQTA